MMADDMATLARWQTPGANADRLPHDINAMVDELLEISRHRDGVKFLRARYRELFAANEKLDELIWALIETEKEEGVK